MKEREETPVSIGEQDAGGAVGKHWAASGEGKEGRAALLENTPRFSFRIVGEIEGNFFDLMGMPGKNEDSIKQN